MEPKDVLLLHRQLVEDLARSVCRRHAVYGAEQDDFVSSCWLRLIEDDYALPRKFEHRSEFGTYLASVVYSLFSEYRRSRWGRQRTSANAKRLGEFAVRLERLLQRERCSLHEATEILRSAGETIPRPRDLARIVALIRPPAPSQSRDFRIEQLPAADSTDWLAIHNEWERRREFVADALDKAMQGLSREDELILWLHHWEGMPVYDIARTLRLSPQPLYRRLRGLYPMLRVTLEAMGVRGEQVADLLQTADEIR